MTAPLQGIGHRIESIKNHYNYTNEELGKVCGVSYAAIAKIIHGTTKDPSVSIFIKILQKLDISQDWLLFGKGKMLRSEESETKNEPQDGVKYLKQEIENLHLIIRSKDGEIETLKKMVNFLENNHKYSSGRNQA